MRKAVSFYGNSVALCEANVALYKTTLNFSAETFSLAVLLALTPNGAK